MHIDAPHRGRDSKRQFKRTSVNMIPVYLKFKKQTSETLFAPRMFAPRAGQKSPTALHDESSADKDKDDSINYTTVDWREFMCNTWHLEPTLRLISWTGRKIDPVGVDYILQKLGFHHVLSVLIKKLGEDKQASPYTQLHEALIYSDQQKHYSSGSFHFEKREKHEE
uniref:Bridge-like lipid transfer protein family member 1 C-terminal domain-containing protein n=1 Tax=Neolamprologus brichardi TaxID=32507 RepID=A0A3Q4ID33_NEOBR